MLRMVSQPVSSPTVTRCQSGRASAALKFLLELCQTDPGTPTRMMVWLMLQWSLVVVIVRKYIALFMQFLLGGCLGILHDVDWFKLHPLLIVLNTKM